MNLKSIYIYTRKDNKSNWVLKHCTVLYHSCKRAKIDYCQQYKLDEDLVMARVKQIGVM
jgi:hypothetical protein